MDKESKTCSTITLHLRTEIWQEDRLNNMYETARKIYNVCVEKTTAQFNQMTRTKKYREIQERIKEEIKRIETEREQFDLAEKKKEEEANAKEKKYKVKSFKEDKAALKELYNQKNEMLMEWGFTKYGIYEKVSRYVGTLSHTIFSVVAICSIADPLWNAYNRLLFKNGEYIHYKKFGSLNNLSSNNKTGIRFREINGEYYVIVGSNRTKTKVMKIKVEPFGHQKNNKFSDYEINMINRPIRQVKIIRKEVGTGYSYFCQLVVEGSPYIKQENNSDKYPVNSGIVGLSIWRNTLCAVSDKGYKIFDLCPDFESYEAQKKLFSTELENLRRINNPDNFNEDGTVKKGIVVDGVRERLKWKESNRYKQVKIQLRELQRKNKEARNLRQNHIIHELLEMGDCFYMADMSFLTNKPEWDEENPLPNSEYKKKKKRRISIQESAPSQLLLKLDNKLAAYDRPFIYKIKLSDNQYWYHHRYNDERKEMFNGDKVKVGEKLCDHTVYRAWLAYHHDTVTNTYENLEKDEYLLFEKL